MEIFRAIPIKSTVSKWSGVIFEGYSMQDLFNRYTNNNALPIFAYKAKIVCSIYY